MDRSSCRDHKNETDVKLGLNKTGSAGEFVDGSVSHLNKARLGSLEQKKLCFKLCLSSMSFLCNIQIKTQRLK